MAFATTYFEASHNRDQADTPTVYTVSGWLGFVEKWADFEAAWLAALPLELEGFFHMTDFANDQKQYASWCLPRCFS